MDRLSRFMLALLAVLSLALTAANLSRPLANPDEGRYSEISREMAESGDWVTPRLNGLKYLEKPPLQYWATAAAFRIFGVHEWSARLYVALCALGTIALVAFTAARLASRDEGLAAALVLLASPYFMALSGAVTLDMALTFWLTAVLCAWLLAERPGLDAAMRQRWVLAAWGAMAMAVLSKGLVGLVIPAAALGLDALLRRDFSIVRRMEWLRGGALFVLLAAPWFVAVSMANAEFARFFFLHEHFERFLTAQHRRVEPWWYFAPIVLLGLLPMAGLVLPAITRTWRDAGPWRLAATWAAFVIVFFSLSGSKLPAYVLPAFPALALVLAPYLARSPPRRMAPWVAPAAVVGLAGAAVATRASERAREDWTRLLYAEAEPWIVAAALSLAVMSIVAVVLLWRGRRWPGLAAAALGVVAALGCGLQAFELFAPRQSGKQLALRMKALTKPDTRVYSVDIYDQSATFYLGRTLTLVKYRDEFGPGLDAEPHKAIETLEAFLEDWRRPGEALAIMQPGHYHRLSAQGLPFQAVHEDSRRVLVRKP